MVLENVLVLYASTIQRFFFTPSLQIKPANTLPRRGKGHLVIINLQATPLDAHAALVIRAPCDEVSYFLAVIILVLDTLARNPLLMGQKIFRFLLRFCLV